MQALRSITSILLILSTLWAGTGFTVSRHYCMGMLKSEYFYFDADSCEGAKQKTTCSSTLNCFENNCCEHEILSVAAIEIKRFDNKSLTKNSDSKAFITPPTIARDLPAEAENLGLFIYQAPELPPGDILSEIQRYLI